LAELVHDPVNRVRYAFQRDGENLIVDCLVDPGGTLPAHRHPRQVERWSGDAIVPPIDASAVVHARSSSRRTPDPLTAGLSRNAHHPGS
jgi:hypothetical protein